MATDREIEIALENRFDGCDEFLIVQELLDLEEKHGKLQDDYDDLEKERDELECNFQELRDEIDDIKG